MIFHKSHIAGYNGKYSKLDLDDMIYNNGYIPVASSLEFNNLRKTTTQIMGAGTPYWSTYTTGLDKKYVQINNIDLSGFANFMPFGLSTSGVPVFFTGIYDGNKLQISNLSFARVRENGESYGFRGLFCKIQSATLTNIILNNVKITASGSNIDCGSLVGHVSTSSIVSNCEVSSAIVYGHQRVGGLIGSVSGYGATNFITITNNIVVNVSLYRSNLTAHSYQGGLIGGITKDGTTMTAIVNISKCYCLFVYTEDAYYSGGFIGYTQIGYGRLNIDDCHVNNSTLKSTYTAAGFIGRLLTNVFITNCYVQINELVGTTIGGFIGSRIGGTITNCYYDKDTCGFNDTGKGLPRSTNQMKQGVQDSTVEGEAMYTNWGSNVWNFGDANDYPFLK